MPAHITETAAQSSVISLIKSSSVQGISVSMGAGLYQFLELPQSNEKVYVLSTDIGPVDIGICELTGGKDGQILEIIKTDPTSTLTLHCIVSLAGYAPIFTASQHDETIPLGQLGGWTLFYNTDSWWAFSTPRGAVIG
jgi:hypothetical protein